MTSIAAATAVSADPPNGRNWTNFKYCSVRLGQGCIDGVKRALMLTQRSEVRRTCDSEQLLNDENVFRTVFSRGLGEGRQNRLDAGEEAEKVCRGRWGKRDGGEGAGEKVEAVADAGVQIACGGLWRSRGDV